MQPYSQPFFWLVTANQINTVRYWFNGLPVHGINRIATPTRSVKYWFNGLPAPALK